MRSPIRRISTTCVLALALTASTLAQTCETQLVPLDGDANGFHGAAVLLDDDNLLVGSPGQREATGTDPVGSVFVYGRNSASSPWQHRTEIQPTTLVHRDNFGAALAKDGDTLVVAAPGVSGFGSTGPGKVHIFRRVSETQWDEEAVLEPSDGAIGDRFGASVAFEGDTLLVGAPSHDDAVTPGGSVYVFNRTGQTWSEDQRIDRPAGANGSGFGFSVGMSGDLACVGGPSLSVTTTIGGGVAAYSRDALGNWTFLETVQPTGLAIADRYGESIAMEGTSLAVGAPMTDGAVNGSGAVYTFDYDALALTFGAAVRHEPLGATVRHEFGQALALDGDRLLVGAPRVNSCFVLDRTAGVWSETRGVTPTLAQGLSAVGTAIDLNGDAAAIGDSTDSPFIFREGVVYVSDVNLDDVDGNGVSDVCEGWWSTYCTQTVPNSSGSFATLTAIGSPFAADQTLALLIEDLPPFQFSLVVGSQSQDLVITPGGSQGNLCLGGTIGRFNAQIAAASFGGTLLVDVPIGAMPPPLPMAVQPGDSWSFQVWHRDANPSQTANFSDAIQVTYL